MKNEKEKSEKVRRVKPAEGERRVEKRKIEKPAERTLKIEKRKTEKPAEKVLKIEKRKIEKSSEGGLRIERRREEKPLEGGLRIEKRRGERPSVGEEKSERPQFSGKKVAGRPKTIRRKSAEASGEELIRLNKYIANSGMCSRREADRMIEAGIVSVNGKIVTELGTKVSLTDKVKYGDDTINREKPRYLLLNKPKGYITTVDDPEKRKTVMALIEGACKERIYPVGRLDRNTTGLLLFTNDGNIAKKLTHPRYGIKKIYHVELDKNLTRAEYDKIAEGFKLDDEFIQVDVIEYIGDGKDKKQIGIELHSGQNRIVRRIFEHFEYKVVRLDRVYYAGLTKKNLPRGTWRFLGEQEINMLKMISSKP